MVLGVAVSASAAAGGAAAAVTDGAAAVAAGPRPAGAMRCKAARCEAAAVGLPAVGVSPSSSTDRWLGRTVGALALSLAHGAAKQRAGTLALHDGGGLAEGIMLAQAMGGAGAGGGGVGLQQLMLAQAMAGGKGGKKTGSGANTAAMMMLLGAGGAGGAGGLAGAFGGAHDAKLALRPSDLMGIMLPDKKRGGKSKAAEVIDYISKGPTQSEIARCMALLARVKRYLGTKERSRHSSRSAKLERQKKSLVSEIRKLKEKARAEAKAATAAGMTAYGLSFSTSSVPSVSMANYCVYSPKAALGPLWQNFPIGQPIAIIDSTTADGAIEGSIGFLVMVNKEFHFVRPEATVKVAGSRVAIRQNCVMVEDVETKTFTAEEAKKLIAAVEQKLQNSRMMSMMKKMMKDEKDGKKKDDDGMDMFMALFVSQLSSIQSIASGNPVLAVEYMRKDPLLSGLLAEALNASKKGGADGGGGLDLMQLMWGGTDGLMKKPEMANMIEMLRATGSASFFAKTYSDYITLYMRSSLGQLCAFLQSDTVRQHVRLGEAGDIPVAFPYGNSVRTSVQVRSLQTSFAPRIPAIFVCRSPQEAQAFAERLKGAAPATPGEIPRVSDSGSGPFAWQPGYVAPEAAPPAVHFQPQPYGAPQYSTMPTNVPANGFSQTPASFAPSAPPPVHSQAPQSRALLDEQLCATRR